MSWPRRTSPPPPPVADPTPKPSADTGPARRLGLPEFQKILTARLSTGRELLVDLRSELFVYRPSTDALRRRAAVLEAMAHPFGGPEELFSEEILADLLDRGHFRRITTLDQLIGGWIEQTLKGCELLDRGMVALPYDALAACRLAGRLEAQVTAKPAAVISADALAPLAVLLRGRPRRDGLERSIAQRLTLVGDRLRRQAADHGKDHGKNIITLRLRRQAEAVAVEWVGDDGATAHREGLDSFYDRVLAPVIGQVIDKARRRAPGERRKLEEGMETLRGVCPIAAAAVERASRDRKKVGTRLFRAFVRRNMPLDVWLNVNPGLSESRCMLSVYRAHRDFILGASEGGEFYFPPCLLTARLSFGSGAVRLMPPKVRQPRGGHAWCHPYTGVVGHDPVGGAILIEEPHEGDVMYEPSPEALRLFPGLCSRTAKAGETDLCLAGQQQRMQKLQRDLKSNIAARKEIDVLRIVTEVHDIVRLGLTRGHQNNLDRPRVPLTQESMPHRIRGRVTTGLLARRTFPFDPRQPAP